MKPTRPFTIVALAGICAIAAFSQDTRAQDANEASKIKKGYSIAPVPLNLAGTNHADAQPVAPVLVNLPDDSKPI